MVCGEKDRANKKAEKNLTKSIIIAEIQLIKNVRHDVNIDAPKKLAEILNSFYYRHQL